MRVLITMFIFLFGFSVFAQDVDEKITTEQIWLDYNPSFPLSERLDAYGDVGARTVFPNEWYRFVIGPSIRYKFPKLILKEFHYKEELHFGIRFFFTANKSFSNRLEIRPFQGYRLAWPDRPRIVIRHYVRLEERFDIETTNWINTFGLRVRYMAELTLKFKGDLISFNDGLYLPVSLELFWNLIGTKQFNDVVRILPGIGYEISPDTKVSFNVGYFYTRNTVENNFATNDIVFRLRLFHKLH